MFKDLRVPLLLLALAVPVAPSIAQTLAPEFQADYDLVVLGSAAGVSPPYGGVFILPSQPDTLYIGGAANNASGGLYAIDLVRDGSGLITGFSGVATRVADAPHNDGGIVPDPGGLISFARWPVNRYAQIDLSTGTIVNDVDLVPFGVASASSSLGFIPTGYPGAGGMRLASWSGGEFYAIDYSIGPGGIISLNAVTPVPGSTLPGGPEGWAYVPLGSPQFPQPSMVVSEYSANTVAVFEMDAAGNPVIASRRVFVSGLSGAEGAAIDPVSGSFVFSTFGGGDQVLVVNGFSVPVGSITLSPPSFDFGTIPVGQSSPSQPFVLSNVGAVAVSVTAITVAGGAYAIASSDCPQGGSLAAGVSCTIQVACAPAAVGPLPGSLAVATDAGDLSSTLQCAGAGVTPPAAPTPVPVNGRWSLLLLVTGVLALALAGLGRRGRSSTR